MANRHLLAGSCRHALTQAKALAGLALVLVSVLAIATAASSKYPLDHVSQISHARLKLLNSFRYLLLYIQLSTPLIVSIPAGLAWRQLRPQNLPEYQLFPDNGDESANSRLGETDRLAFESLPNYYTTTPNEGSSYSQTSEVDREDLLHQLKLARQLLNDKLVQAVSSQPLIRQQKQTFEPDNSKYLSQDNLNSIEREELADKLADLLHHQQQQQAPLLYDSPIINPDSSIVKSTAPLSLESDQLDNKVTFEKQQDDQLNVDASEQALKIEDIYELQENKRQAGDDSNGAGAKTDLDNHHKTGRYTTLLEDSEQTKGAENEASTTVPTTTQNLSDVTPTTVFYGKVMHLQHDTYDNKEPDSISAVLGRFLRKLASYVPFLNRLAIFNSGYEQTTNMTTKKVMINQDKQPNQEIRQANNINHNTENKTSSSVSQVQVDLETKRSIQHQHNGDAIEPGGVITKQSISDTTANQSDQIAKTNDENSEFDKIQKNDNSDKPMNIGLSNQIKQQRDLSTDDADNSFASIGTFTGVNEAASNNRNNNNNIKAQKQLAIKARLENSKRVHVASNTDNKLPDVDIDDVLPIRQQQPLGEHFGKISLIKQSNLVLPFGSDDNLVSGSSSKNPADELIGKYIYAPTHHYYLNTDKSSPSLDESDASRFYTQMSHRSFVSPDSKHRQHQFEPGDQVYGSYEMPLKSAYVYQKNGVEGLLVNGNKTNDLYFLVMVGAFCVMAMAVVLAAGLFAYRTQQNRKSSNDQDYPTYGVVGPNNINGKCGAAAFVDGYLGGTGGPGSSGSFGSKLGSAKHFPDLYASDSGLASIEKTSSKKASSASSSDQQQANRTTPTNFLANQDAARMYHYQHQKQQMIISDRSSAGRNTSASDLDSEDENEDGSYTVYECPGLASAHEMEIKNPLFNDDQTP